MTRFVAGYLRVSHAEEDGRSFEEQQEGQRQAIVRLALRGSPDVEVVEFIDWDRSADPDKEHRRQAFNDMLAAIERGDVTAVYARSLDRLYRSPKTLYRLMDACKRHGVTVETEREGLLGGDGSPMARAFADITAVFAELELNTAKARAKSRVTRQKAAIAEHGVTGCAGPEVCGKVTNHYLGNPPYGALPGEDWAHVIDVFKAEGSYQGAARSLIAEGFASRRSHLTNKKGRGEVMQTWSASTVREVVRLRAPGLVPSRPVRRSRTIAIRLFTRLLICPHDGTYLTSQVGRGITTGYICRVGHTAPDGQHPRPYALREAVVLDWARRATANIVNRVEEVAYDDGAETSAAELRAKRERVGHAYVDGVFGEDQYHAHLTAIDEELDRLASLKRASGTWRQGIDWKAPVGEVNARLRDLLVGIQLGWVEDGPLRGRHSRLTRSLVPVGGVWKRRPVLHLYDEWDSTVPDPTAEPSMGGWLLLDEGSAGDELIARVGAKLPVPGRRPARVPLNR